MSEDPVPQIKFYEEVSDMSSDDLKVSSVSPLVSKELGCAEEGEIFSTFLIIFDLGVPDKKV